MTRADRRGRARSLAVVLVALLATACSVLSPSTGRPGEQPGSGTASPSPTAAVSSATESALAGTRPNVLVIETDDMRVDDLRFMPHVRRLIQRRGLSFENSFAPNPLCCPSRASFLSGQYSHNHAVLSHQRPYGFSAFDDSDTLATRLEAAGYQTALIGKYLNYYGERPVHGTGEPSLHYVPPGWTQWYGSTDHVFPRSSPLRGGTYNYFHLTSNVNGKLRTWPGQYTTLVTAGQATRLAERFAEDPEQRPWFVWWNPVAPHHGFPFEADDVVRLRQTNGVVRRWLSPVRPDWIKGAYDDQVPRGAGVPPTGDPEPDRTDKPDYLSRLPPLSAAELTAEQSLTRQRAEALGVLDRQIGKLLHRLRDDGALDGTIVVFTSDNGFYLGEHDKRFGKITPHEPSIRVPLMITGPGIPRGHRYDPVATIDLAPTFAAWAGTDLKDPDGIDLSATIESGDVGWQRPILLEGVMEEPGYPGALTIAGEQRLSIVGVRLGRWKLMLYSTGETEWYDLEKDPLEMESIPADRVPAEVADQLRTLLGDQVACAGDSCRVPLPASLTLDPDTNRELTRRQARATQAYYQVGR